MLLQPNSNSTHSINHRRIHLKLFSDIVRLNCLRRWSSDSMLMSCKFALLDLWGESERQILEFLRAVCSVESFEWCWDRFDWPSSGALFMPKIGASVAICHRTPKNSTSSMPVRVISAATACKNNFSYFVQLRMARTRGLVNISVSAWFTCAKLTTWSLGSSLFSSAISVARRHMSSARRQSPDTDATFLLGTQIRKEYVHNQILAIKENYNIWDYGRLYLTWLPIERHRWQSTLSRLTVP